MMDSNIDPTILDGINYVVWVLYMETLLKIKGLWKYTKTDILEHKVEHVKFVVDGKKYEVVGVIMTYISHRFSCIQVGLTTLMKFEII
jgi:hypothetical protein